MAVSPAADLAAHLSAERDALRAFIALLETEQKDLVGGRMEQLLDLADRKTRAAQELNRMEGERKDKLRARRVAGSPEDWLRTQAEADLRQSWNDILQLAGQAQEINRTNGILIQTRLRHNQQALTVLYKASSDVQGLYGPDGQTHISPAGRSLGSG